jgi:hypothetical protein
VARDGRGLRSAYLVLRFDKPKFLVDLGTKKWMTIWYHGQYVTRLPLAGALAAVGDLAQCVQSDGDGYRYGDPFDADESDSRWKPNDRPPRVGPDTV